MGKGQKYFDSGDYNMAKQGGRLGRGEFNRINLCKVKGWDLCG